METMLSDYEQRNSSYDTLSTDSTRMLTDYFDRHGSRSQRLRAWYLLGCAHDCAGESPQALDCFYKALDHADTTRQDCDYRKLSRIYGQIAAIFNKQRAPRLEIEAELKAVDYAWKAKDTLAAIVFFQHLSDPYHMLNRMDSALYYSLESARMSVEIGRRDMAAAAIGSCIDIYLRRKDFEKAKTAIKEYEEYSTFLDSCGNIRKGAEVYYYYKGTYYESVSQPDSAEHYYRKLLASDTTIISEEAAYKGLLSLYAKLGRADSMAKYSVLFCQANDSASIASSSEEIVRMNAVYNYSSSERKAKEKEQETTRYKTFLTACIIVVLLLVCLVFYRLRQKQLKRRIQLAELQRQSEQSHRELELAQSNFEDFKKQKTLEIETLQNAIAQMTSKTTAWNEERMLQNNPIVKHIHSLSSKAEIISDQEWHELASVVRGHYPALFHAIDNCKKPLTYTEQQVCILSKLHFDAAEITVVLGLTPQRTTNIKSSVNVKLFNDKGAKTLIANLSRLK